MSDPGDTDEQDREQSEEQVGSKGPDDSDGQSESAGQGEVSEQDVEEIEAEREKRLAADNRPENAEVDNTQRTFDPETGMFTDEDGQEEAEPKFVPDEEL